MHESYERVEEHANPSERSFGFVMAIFFTLITLFPLVHGAGAVLHWWAFGIAMAFAGAALFWNAPLKPLNWLWLRFGSLLHRLVSPIVTGLVFFVVVVPTGLIMRAFKVDHLRLRRDPSLPTYWINSESTETDMKDQF